MIDDLATYSLAFHGPVCAFLWLVVLKLGGESEFGTKTLADIEKLRARLLRAIAVSLKGVFEPILMDASTVNVSSLVLPDQDDDGRSRGITKLGEEKLLNAVRDFVNLLKDKSDDSRAIIKSPCGSGWVRDQSYTRFRIRATA